MIKFYSQSSEGRDVVLPNSWMRLETPLKDLTENAKEVFAAEGRDMHKVKMPQKSLAWECTPAPRESHGSNKY